MGWAVGSEGTILGLGSSGWESFDSPTHNDFASVVALSPSIAWTVGENGTILRWDGVIWSVVPSPTGALDLSSVSMASPDDGWVVGEGGATLRWDGDEWRSFAGDPIVSGLGLHSVGLVPGQDAAAPGLRAVAVGVDGWSGPAMLAHWDGTDWTAVASPAGRQHELLDVAMVSSIDGWAVGGVEDGPGIILRYVPNP
jgi:photosystem II stability/assembly factor-like uncharacterized protein